LSSIEDKQNRKVNIYLADTENESKFVLTELFKKHKIDNEVHHLKKYTEVETFLFGLGEGPLYLIPSLIIVNINLFESDNIDSESAIKNINLLNSNENMIHFFDKITSLDDKCLLECFLNKNKFCLK
jgi:hypothetical protein